MFYDIILFTFKMLDLKLNQQICNDFPFKDGKNPVKKDFV